MFFILILLAIKTGFGQYGNWEIVGNGKLPMGLYGHEAVVVDSTIYLLGGFSDSTQSYSNTIYAYQPRTNEWSIAGKMIKARKSFLADKLGSKIIYFGGEEKNSKDTAAGLVEVFDTKTGTVSPLFYNKAFNRNNLTGMIVDSVFYVLGGQLYNEPVLPKQWQNFSFDLRSYDFGKMYLYLLDNWNVKGEMSARLGPNIFIFGGLNYSMLSSIVYTNIDNNLTEIDMGWYMKGARTNGRALPIGQNQIMVVGGFDEINLALNTVDIYQINDLVKQPSVITGGSMMFRRKDFTAVIFDNYVYAFGGADEFGRVPYIIERYKILPLAANVPGSNLPSGYGLSQNYPNPFNPFTTISYDLPNRCFVNIKVFNALGSQVAELVNKTMEPGSHTVNFDGSRLTSGIYFYRITTSVSDGFRPAKESAGNMIFTETKKMVLLK
jgi:hypothetical protein